MAVGVWDSSTFLPAETDKGICYIEDKGVDQPTRALPAAFFFNFPFPC